MFYSREKHVVVLEKGDKTKVVLVLSKQPFLSIVPYCHVASLITPMAYHCNMPVYVVNYVRNYSPHTCVRRM